MLDSTCLTLNTISFSDSVFSQKRAEVSSKIPEPNETTKVLEDYLLFQSEDLSISDEKIVTPRVVSERTLGTNSPLLSLVTSGMISKRVNSEMLSQLTSRKTSNLGIFDILNYSRRFKRQISSRFLDSFLTFGKFQ